MYVSAITCSVHAAPLLTYCRSRRTRPHRAKTTYSYACKYVCICACMYELLALLAGSLLCYFCFAVLTLGLFALLASPPFVFNCWLVACWRLYEYYCFCFSLLAQSQMLKWPGRLLSLHGVVLFCVPRAYILAHICSQSIEPRTIPFL